MRNIYALKKGRSYDLLDEGSNNIFHSNRFNCDVPLKHLMQMREDSGFSFVAGEGFTVSDVDIPESRFTDLHQVTPEMFKLENTGNGIFSIRNVPLYKAHGDTRKNGHVSSHAFIDRMIKNFYLTRKATLDVFGDSAFSWLPKFHYGHTPNNPDLPEKSNVGFVDNLFRVGDFLFGDITGLDKNAVEALTSGTYPDRSAEIDIKRARMLSVAALGFRTPHFALPQMRADTLRQKYASIMKHNYGGITSVVLLKEDIMPTATIKGRKNSLDPAVVGKFFIELETNDTLREKFEAIRDEAIQKNMDMNGGVSPSGGGLQQIIMQILQQMIGQKMNTESNNPYQMNASDVLDFESAAHHAAGDQGTEEEGTEAAGEDSRGLRKGKRAGDTGVDSDGSPSESESGMDGDDDIIDSSGDVVEKSILQATNTIKNAMSKLPSGMKEQVETAMNDVQDTIKHMAGYLSKQGKALVNLQKENSKQRFSRRKESFSNRLHTMCQSGNPSVANTSMLKDHLDLLLGLSDIQAEKFLAVLEKTPLVTPTRHIKRGDAITSDNNEFSARIKREHNNLPRFIRENVSEEAVAVADIWESFDTNEGGA